MAVQDLSNNNTWFKDEEKCHFPTRTVGFLYKRYQGIRISRIHSYKQSGNIVVVEYCDSKIFSHVTVRSITKPLFLRLACFFYEPL